MPASGQAVGVAMTGRASVQVFDGGYLVAWSDSRRLHLMSRPPRAVEVDDDVWVKFVGARPESAKLFCPTPRSVSTPRLAVSRTTGTAGLVWSEVRFDGGLLDPGVTHLARLDTSGALDTQGECGLLLPSSLLTTSEVSARGSDFVVVLSLPTRIDRFDVVGTTVTNPGGAMTGPHSNVITVEGAVSTYIGWQQAGSLVLMREGLTVPTSQLLNAFDLVGGTDPPELGYVTTSGFVPPIGSATFALPANPDDRPFGARFGDGGLAFVYAFDAGTRLWTSTPPDTSMRLEAPGRPEGLALRSTEGLALVSHPPGVLGGVGLAAAAPSGPFSFVANPLPLSTARVLQRRPSLAWDARVGGWVVVWEEASSATTWTSRRAVVMPDGAQQLPTELFIDGGWPRVVGLLDGGLSFFALDDGTTNFVFSAPGSAGSPVTVTESLDASIQGVVPAPSTGFAWTPQHLVNHTELVMRGAAVVPLARDVQGEVTCAAWASGEFIVTRLGVAGAVSISRFADDSLPSMGQVRTGNRSCVATEPFAVPPRVGFVTSYEPASRIAVETLDGGTWTVEVDAGVRDLQMTAIDGQWLAVWDTEAGLFAGLFAEGQRPRLAQLDTTPGTHRGAPVVASSSAHVTAVAWPVLVNDSVLIRLRTIPVFVTDGGLDGGDADAGAPDAAVFDDGGVGVPDAGAPDASVFDDGGVGVPDGGAPDAAVFDDGGVGVPDAGAPDAAVLDDGGVVADGGSMDAGVAVWVPVCGCGSPSPDGLSAVLLGLVMLAMRRRASNL